MNDQPIYSRLHPNDMAGFETAYRIYVDSIPARERKSEPTMRAMLHRADFQFRVATIGNTVVGMAVLFVPPEERMALLEYMAVDPAQRGRRIGSGLFVDCAATVRETDRDAVMLIEVESDGDACEERPIRQQRLAFYRRMGCRQVGNFNYILPLPGDGPPPQMVLLATSSAPLAEVPRAQIRRWLELIYTGVYGCPPNDRRIDQMIGERAPLR